MVSVRRFSSPYETSSLLCLNEGYYDAPLPYYNNGPYRGQGGYAVGGDFEEQEGLNDPSVRGGSRGSRGGRGRGRGGGRGRRRGTKTEKLVS